MERFRRIEADIDLDAIRHNIQTVQALNPSDRKTLLVIKADAYGHGSVVLARETSDLADYFGVACIDEALELRRAGIEKPVLILGYTDETHFDELIDNDITAAMYDADEAAKLSEQALKKGKKARVHIAVDTGMTRIGFYHDEAGVNEAAKLLDMKGLNVEGIFSHFARADEIDKTAAKEQQRYMRYMVGELTKRGADFKIKHLDNSAGAMELHTDGFDMMRLGIVIYGLYPSDEMDRSVVIKPAMTLKSRVVHIQNVGPGRAVSYGGTFVTERPMKIATVSAGYADGYPRSQSNSGTVLIGGRRVPILGRVCMDQFMIDVTDIPDVRIGSEVVLFGKQGDEEISVEEVAAPANSFNYELVCNISRRVPRVYYKGGEKLESVSYLNYRF